MRPKDLPSLLASVDDVDPKWLQSVFLLAGIDTPPIASTRVTPIGHGNLSETAKISVSYEQAAPEAPDSVVCKFASHRPAAQAFVQRYRPYVTEVSVYRLFGSRPPVQTPRVFFAECSADGAAVNLVFEDLSVCCEPGDQATGCTPAQATTVIEQLALLHRHYWTKPSLADLPWTANRRQPESDLKDLYASGASVFIDRYQNALSSNDCETIEAFVPLAEVWRKQSVSAPTLLHGDARLDNVMFRKAPDTALSAYLLDWQCARVGDAQSDVAYFLSGSLASSDRATHERDLIAAHAQIIRGIDPDYTTERALNAYQANIVSGLYLTVVAATALPHTRTSEKLLTALVARNCAAVRDWNALEVIERSR